MHRALAPITALLLVAGCEATSTGDRIKIEVAGGEPTVRMDLEPVTLAADVDNNVKISVTFDEDPNATTNADNAPIVEFTQYRIDYGLGEEEAPYIAGEIFLRVAVDATEEILLRGAVEDQLDWVANRYRGDELDVAARVSLAGIYEDLEGVTVSAEYTATFADYR